MAAKKKTPKKKAKEQPIPSWYYRHGMPYVPPVPQEQIPVRKLVNTIRLSDSDEIPFKQGSRYYLEVECNYDGSDDIYMCEFTETMHTNPHYKDQVKKYEEALARVEEWKKITATYDERKKAQDDAAELALYKKLKKKYG